MAKKKITPRGVFFKTMPFAWAKLLLGFATVALSVIIFALLTGIAYLFKSDYVFLFMCIIWLGATGAVNFILNHYIGYLVRAGHIAVITEAVKTGNVPDHQLGYGMKMVKERFLTSSVYFVIDRLVTGAVKQLQRAVKKIGGAASFVPGMNYITNITNLFLSIALGYIDECCLGYTFLHKTQSAFKSAADGVVVYWKNWKTLLKDAAITTVIVIVLIVAVTVAAFLVSSMVFVRLLGWNGIVAFLIAVFAAWAVKKAFIDSYMMVKMMVSYMEVAPSTAFTSDLYNKLCGLSSKFKELFNRNDGKTPAARSRVRAKKKR
ncbi:MAG: hypothetical protein LBB81_09675 [Treponema sp.]|jgi:hypothetical protein|nr:hypothetical protein [Treponema sp.]